MLRRTVTAAALLMSPAAAILVAAWTPIDFGISIVLSFVPAALGLSWILTGSQTRADAIRARAGVIAGAAALLAYDLVRLGLQAAGLVAEPFRAIALYGDALVSASVAGTILGWAYHVWNGLTFAMFYTLIVPRPGVPTAVGWALLLDALQTLTVAEIPGVAIGREFLTASIIGHTAFGVTLGIVARRLVAHSEMLRRA